MSYENLQPALERIKMTVGFIADHGMRTQTVFDLEESFIGTPQMAACVEAMKQDPEMSKLLSEGYTTPDYNLDELEKYPRGSLAYTYAKMMKAEGFDPKFYTDLPITDDTSYIIMRCRKTHDIHHCITGFGPANGGELAVIAVSGYQFGYPAFNMIDLTAIALAFRKSEGFRQSIDLVAAGIKTARAAKNFAGIKWEDGWEKPIDQWRQELNVEPCTNTPFSWYVTAPNLVL